MSGNIPEDFYKILKNTLDEPVDHFSLEISSDIGGKGHCGEFVSTTLTDKITKEKHFILIKKESNSSEHIRILFNNEIHFYKNIWPKLNTFYTETTGRQAFFIPKCFGTSEENVRAIAMENLEASGYHIYLEGAPLDNAHMEIIFQTYGIFHGISMALKEKEPEEFWKLSNGIQYKWKYDLVMDNSVFKQAMCYSAGIAKTFFDETEEKEIVNKLVEYPDKGPELVYNTLNRNSVSRIITHGDCHMKNMMFRYCENGRVQDIKLFDFQIASAGSPIQDLSYCYYSGRKCFSDIQKYQKIYYDSLSNTLREFGLNVDEIYSFDTFLAEWKEQCKFGFLLALMVWNLRCSAPNSKVLMMEDNKLIPWDTAENKIDELKEVMRNLVLHMFNNDFL